MDAADWMSSADGGPRDAAIGVFDIAGGQIQRVDIGDAAGAVDDAIGLGRLFGAVMGEDHPQPAVGRLDPLDADPGLDANADAFALGLDTRDRVGIHRRQQLRQRFEDRDFRAGARIDVAEFERDHAAADEDHRARQLALAQHLVRGDHVLGAGNRQRPRLRAGRNHDVFGFELAIADADGFGTGENRVALDHLDITMAIERARLAGMSLIISFSRSISAAQSSFGLPTAM